MYLPSKMSPQNNIANVVVYTIMKEKYIAEKESIQKINKGIHCKYMEGQDTIVHNINQTRKM